VVVNSYSERWLQQGFPWVYRDEVVARTGSLQPGRVVGIRSRSGAVLGTGIWDDSHVELRRFRSDEGPVDAALLHQRLSRARARRVLPPETTAWRWVHGENDGLPGIRVDVWGQDLSVVLDSSSLHGLVPSLIEGLVALHNTRAVWLSWRIEQRRGKATEEEDGAEPAAPEIKSHGLQWGLAGHEDVLVTERGQRFHVRPWEGHDVGLYCDMRDLRSFLAPHWGGKKVLNTFAYTGAFSVAAALGGASEVVSVDLSAASLERAQTNFLLNQIDPAAHRFVPTDVFRAMDTLRRKGESFDVVVVDPPSYSHGPEGHLSLKKDLPRLVAASLRLLSPDGWLVIATNQGRVSPRDFQKQIQAGAARAERSLRLIHQGSQPIDFPAALDFPESRYLKCWVLQG
jgi:23S rRNA (cytosine1962-C5)-methyltransferase